MELLSTEALKSIEAPKASSSPLLSLSLLLCVERVLTAVKLLPLLRVRQDLLGRGDVHELLLGLLLLFLTLKLVRMPQDCESTVRLHEDKEGGTGIKQRKGYQ